MTQPTASGMDEAAPPHRRRILLAVQVLASAALITYLIARMEPEDTRSIVRHVRSIEWMSAVPLALLVAGTGAASIVASGFRLHAVARRRGADLSVIDAVQVNCLGLLASVFTPLGLVGDGLRGMLLVRRHRVHVRDSVACVVTDRVAGLIASCIVAGTGLLFAPQVPRATDAIRVLQLTTAIVIGGVLVIIGFAAWMRAAGSSGNGRWRSRIRRFEVVDLGALRSPVVIGAGLIGQLLETVSAMAVLWLFGFHRTPVAYIAVVSSFLPILEALPAAFIGIGAREGALEYLLVQVGEPIGAGVVVGTAGLTIRIAVVVITFLVARSGYGENW